MKIEADRKVKRLRAGGYTYLERRHEKVARTFPLPHDANEDEITSKLHNCVLEVIIPKKTVKLISLQP